MFWDRYVVRGVPRVYLTVTLCQSEWGGAPSHLVERNPEVHPKKAVNQRPGPPRPSLGHTPSLRSLFRSRTHHAMLCLVSSWLTDDFCLFHLLSQLAKGHSRRKKIARPAAQRLVWLVLLCRMRKAMIGMGPCHANRMGLVARPVLNDGHSTQK